MTSSTYQTALRRNRVVVLIALVILIALAWAYTVRLALQMPSASMPMATSASMAMPAPMSWTATDFVYMLVMWSVMMVAMMLPSATPGVLLFHRVGEQRAANGRANASTAIFVSGYLLAWFGFSVLATLANWALHAGGALSSMMGRVAPSAGGALLIAAGAFQFTPLKRACLKHCRTPMGFLTQHWREGNGGALLMGLHHGVYCLGCCWLLMALLFVLGVMNLAWVAALTVAVLAEKLLPGGERIGWGLGALLIVWGGWLLATG